MADQQQVQNVSPDELLTSVNNPLSFEQVFFFHLNRTLNASIEQSSEFKFCVLKLEGLLAPYLDKAYKQRIIILKQRVEQKRKGSKGPYGDYDPGVIMMTEMDFILEKFTELMQLADRQGLMPARKVTDVIE